MERRRTEAICILMGAFCGAALALIELGRMLAAAAGAQVPLELLPTLTAAVAWGAVGALVGGALGWLLGKAVAALRE